MRTTLPTRSLQRILHMRSAASHRIPLFPRSQPHFLSSSLPRTTWPSARTSRSTFAALQTRTLSTEAEEPAQRPLTDRTQADKVTQDQTDAEVIAARKAAAPAYQLWITCKKCLERSSHTISKQAYHFGSCVVQCPKCKSQHLISDNLKIFSDTNITMEDIAKEHGQKLRKGRLGADGDIEFYDEDAEAKVAHAETKAA